jgi:predicted transcriptional regulator
MIKERKKLNESSTLKKYVTEVEKLSEIDEQKGGNFLHTNRQSLSYAMGMHKQREA